MVEVKIEDILKDKKSVKEIFIKKCGFTKKNALVVFFVDNEKDAVIVSEILSVFSEFDASCIVLCKGCDYEKFSCENCFFMDYSEILKEELLVASDIVVDFTNMSVSKILFSRSVAITNEKDGFMDYSPVSEVGNSFIYKNKNALAIFGAIARAIETKKLPYDWKSILRNLV